MTTQAQSVPRAMARPNIRQAFGIVGIAALIAGIVFTAYPELDLTFSQLFIVGPYKGFVFNYPGPGMALRLALRIVFWGGAVTAAAGLLLSCCYARKLLTLGFPQWFFVVACLLIGPGLLSNALLKENWGRARPIHTQNFGGSQPFTPALEPAENCQRNCSFVSGEASSLYALFFALALLVRRRRIAMLLLGVGAGTAAGLVRIAQGGHFLSDVVFAGILMAFVVVSIYWLFFRWKPEFFAENGPIHQKAHSLWAHLGTLGQIAAIAVFFLLIAVAVAVRIASYQKSHRANLAFDGTRVLGTTTNLQTQAYMIDLVLRSHAAGAALEQLPESRLPIVFDGGDIRVVRGGEHYSFQLRGKGEIAAAGTPEKWQRISFVATPDGTARLLLNGTVLWSGSGQFRLNYSTFFLGGTGKPDRYWRGDVYRIAIYRGASLVHDFGPNADISTVGAELYFSVVNPDMEYRPRIPKFVPEATPGRS